MRAQQDTETIRAAAQDHGFDLVGFGSADPFPDGERRLRAWLDAGHAGTMEWLGRDPARRSDPGRVLEGARTVVALGLAYHPRGGRDPVAGSEGAPVLPGRGRIARYARGDDYHALVERKLKALLADLPERLDRAVRGRWYVDTGPVLEREAAARAGIGFVGKNTCLISPTQGSWLFLAALLLDVETVPDDPAGGGCGTCTACLDACPTDAFPAPFVLDARRCISYLTIEHRGAIPADLRAGHGDWIFGCDVCQEVCPWNKFARPTGEPGLRPRRDDVAPELTALLAADDDAFRARFPRSAVRRAKRAGVARNAAIALGNTGGPAAVPALVRALSDDPDPIVRGHAAWALGRIGGGEAARALADAATTERDDTVRQEIAAATPTS